MSDYYARKATANADGTPLFATASDVACQQAVAEMIEQAFGPGLVLKKFGHLCPIDFYAERDGRMAAVLELKSRSHESATYPTVFLNVRKWLALSMAAIGFGVPAFFVVRFTDRVLYVDLRDVDARTHRIGGTRKIVKSRSDREPVVEVPVETMKEVKHGR